MASPDVIDVSNITFAEKLGEGGFAVVHRAVFTKPYKGHTETAAKSVNNDLLKEEVEVMKQLNHPHIVEFLGVYEKGPTTIILLEYAPNGTLRQYLAKDPSVTPVPEDLLRRWAKESSLAIQYLHERKFLHRDIKAPNCLLFQDNLLKLSDYGMSRKFNRSLTTSSTKGTYGHMAPEIIRTNYADRSLFSVYSDIYAYGMLLLEIVTRKPPFDGIEPQAIVFRVGRNNLKPDIPLECPDDLADLMFECWDIDPRSRPTIQQVLTITNPTK
ncbi:mitogen-activated protein kinase kinase kinase 9-like [Amphiura filiformis]|uniref:mitogen-activated protein kinase kinase kinase 9-like n=1 Tax=Amphiura filiformis TaxID=82378 RepID=UPI003B218C1F